ncbi:helix-turn-helix domain-containing protein [Bradyrhizobium sp. 61]|uniref:helix-turn-helix domain-containing protein n=1 Tax=unclassified Bradyrhizobium TaxID=2631580 RepID=UPI001FFA5C16|nr:MULTISPECIES: helix-turn-helix domain-containing protein [unclassified Bradyrhizobium]MCK1273959.1 helix-turn-helix domain-containing protein [Bradyrhizobium sp. 61]MCK1445628.1 helix-turn-helix domain-containing protein [Bradyrhizobium sp. 48]MCK1460601.1 helix-turn-helix domain-containing protein [Bradyrhizobium sp. 2]
MFMRTSSDGAHRPTRLGDFGISSSSNQLVCLSEFTYKKGTVIFAEGDSAEYIYQIKRGAARSYKMLNDGRRQIGAFHLPGDIFGLVNGDLHRFTTEAVVRTTVRLLSRQRLDEVAQSDSVLARELLSLTTQNLQHAEDHMLLLGRKDSVERVAAFLAEMDQRSSATAVMALPMTRRDIADYLGLTIETVSRALSRLRRAGVLEFTEVNHREINILDRQQLHAFDLQSHSGLDLHHEGTD